MATAAPVLADGSLLSRLERTFFRVEELLVLLSGLTVLGLFIAVASVFAVAGLAVSGVSIATSAVFARIAIPEMLKDDYNKRFAARLTSLEQSPMLTLVLILLAYTVLGMFMDAIGMMLLTLPVVFPAIITLNGG